MPPHNAVTALPRRVRDLPTILREAAAARRDLTDAQQSRDTDADDRALEAEQRLDALRDEFDATFTDVTGLTFEHLRDAVAEAVL